MSLVAKSTTFTIPLIGIEAAHLAGDVDMGKRAPNSDHFIADDANVGLKYFCSGNTIQPTDWPLVLFGPAGTGKTAMARSIAARLKPDTNRKIIALSARDFARRFAAAIETNSTDVFRSNMLASAGLFIDDLDDLKDYPVAQVELAHLIDQFAVQQIPLIGTADEKWTLSDSLIPHLHSRLSSGLCLHIHPPGIQARRMMVIKAAEQLGFLLTDEAIEYLAPLLTVPFPKIRLFFGLLRTWQKSVNGERIAKLDREHVAKFFAFSDPSATGPNTVEVILRDVSKAYKLQVSDLKGQSRKQSTVFARGVAIYLIRRLLHLSFSKIGDALGGRDHSTIMHAFKRMENLVQADDLDQVLTIRNIEQTLIENILLNMDRNYG